MKQNLTEKIALPANVTCHAEGTTITCSKGNSSLSRTFVLRGIHFAVLEGMIVVTCPRANKKTRAILLSTLAHLKNMFAGLEQPYVYELEICNVHFPMTVKVEGTKFIVTNFLGEKEKRVATILPHVHVEVKGQKITVSSTDVESAGQTAANIEKATHVTKRDRRVFQDGIFLTSKCGRPI